MSVVEQDRLIEIDEIDHDDLPIGHLPDEESMIGIAIGERPTRALCGAELLGIPTGDTPFRRCDECDAIAREKWSVR